MPHPRNVSACPGAPAGVTFPELLIVLTLIAITTALAGPKTLALLQSAKMASARVQLAAVAEAARAAALQRQRPATISVANIGSSATLTASVDTGGPQPYVVQRLTVATNVTPRLAADVLVTYDARGVITPRRTAALVYLLGPTAGSKDSVCLSKYGHLLPRNCAF